MCGRFNGALTPQEIGKIYHALVVANQPFSPSFNVAPTENTSIVIENKAHEREVHSARFGTPMTAGGKSFPLINLQSEKTNTREGFQKRRCIIPVQGFYEWEKVSPKDKQPYYFSAKEGHLPFAGIWQESANGLSFSILTTAANEMVGPIHGRMPVILSHNAVGEWLSPEADKATLTGLMESYPASLMQVWKVSKAVNSPKNKEAGCINSL